MPNMGAKAADISDPLELLERIAYRNDRLAKNSAEKEDPVAFVKLMCGFNRSDLNRLKTLLDVGSTRNRS